MKALFIIGLVVAFISADYLFVAAIWRHYNPKGPRI
jgi:hypothetical protein